MYMEEFFMEDKRNQKKEIEAMSIKSVRNRNDIP